MDKKTELLRIASQLSSIVDQLTECASGEYEDEEDEKEESSKEPPNRDPKMLAIMLKTKMSKQ